MFAKLRAALPKPVQVGLTILIYALVLLGVVLLLNTFVFRFYTVVGPSMEPTLFTQDNLFVNKLGRTVATITGQSFVPKRGELIVFRNPLLQQEENETYIVKRVIGLPGEHVVVHEGKITIYNADKPEGFNPDQSSNGPKQPTSGEISRLVPEGELFVAGDNRESRYSHDSRNGLSTIPLRDVEGVVAWRVFPFNRMRLF